MIKQNMKPNVIFILLDGARWDRLNESKEFQDVCKKGPKNNFHQKPRSFHTHTHTHTRAAVKKEQFSIMLAQLCHIPLDQLMLHFQVYLERRMVLMHIIRCFD